MGSERVVTLAVGQGGDEPKVRELNNFFWGSGNAGKIVMNHMMVLCKSASIFWCCDLIKV